MWRARNCKDVLFERFLCNGSEKVCLVTTALVPLAGLPKEHDNMAKRTKNAGFARSKRMRMSICLDGPGCAIGERWPRPSASEKGTEELALSPT